MMHGGNIWEAFGPDAENLSNILDLSSSVNPLGFPENLRMHISSAVSTIARYPDPDYRELRAAAALRWSVPANSLVPGNGVSELLMAILGAFNPPLLILPVPAYRDYEGYATRLGIDLIKVHTSDSADYSPADDAFQARLIHAIEDAPEGSMIILANPVNPTGQFFSQGDLEKCIALRDDLYWIIDESYADFTLLPPAEAHSGLTAKEASPTGRVIRLRSLTKIYAVPGLRLGFAIAETLLAKEIKTRLSEWNVNALADHAGRVLLADVEHAEAARQHIFKEREFLVEHMRLIPGVRIIPSEANYVLFQVDKSQIDADQPNVDRHRDDQTDESRVDAQVPADITETLFDYMKSQHILIRDCSDYDLEGNGWYRIAVPLRPDSLRFLDALASFCGVGSGETLSKPARVPAIMFQGTSSNAGKSLMTAAFLRALRRRGIRGVPFKAQNMSLNSAVTPSGGEIGRAQALQAAAAGVEPAVDMNPILLKPESDNGSQLVVLGKATRRYDALSYYAKKAELREMVRDAYDRVAATADIVVLEGAGSPGEVNLKKYDLVNMYMAKYAQAPVVLVGDIDRGGVYAGFIGHMEVFDEIERKLVAGFLVNKFRGDASLLEDAHEYLMEATGKPVFGVMPYAANHRLPEEDGVDFDEKYRIFGEAGDHRVAVVALPRISNATDMDPLMHAGNIQLKFVRTGDELRAFRPDSVIIPGTKSVIADLNWMNQTGISQVICELAEAGAVIAGICGGFQILGERIEDPHGIENVAGSFAAGLGLLPAITTLQPDKTTVLTTAEFAGLNEATTIKGYEIHHGTGAYPAQLELFQTPGLGAIQGRVWGSYLHGCFENPEMIDVLKTAQLSSGTGQASKEPENVYDLNREIDRFTDIFEAHVDVDALIALSGWQQ